MANYIPSKNSGLINDTGATGEEEGVYAIVASSSRAVAVSSSEMRGQEDKTDDSAVMEASTRVVVATNDSGSNRDSDGDYEVVNIKGICSSN